MTHRIRKSIWILLVPIAAALTGCLLSGTFTVDRKFSFNVDEQHYFYAADVTDDANFREHRKEIDNVDMVGFELWMTNESTSPSEFTIYVDDFGEPQWKTVDDIKANTVKVFGDVSVAAGPDKQTHISFGQSLSYFRNVEELRRLAKEGRFHVYGVSTVSPGAGFSIDTARVVVSFTVSAHK